MAIYGRGQMLGSGINPESFKLDYSGMANAAATQAQGVANLGASIGGAIAEVGDYFKKQAEDEKKVQKSLSVAKAIGNLIPGLQPTIQGSLDILNDKKIPLSQRTAEADAISDILNLGINEVRNRQNQESQQASLEQDAAYKKAQLEIAQQNANSRAQSVIAAGNAPPQIVEIAVPGGTQQFQWSGDANSYIPIQVSGLDGANQAVKGDDLIGLVKGFEGFNPKAYNDYKQISIGYGTKGKEGEVLNEEQATERLKSELSGHAERIAKAAELKGIALNQNQFNALTSFDYNTGRGANLIERFGDNPQQLASKILEYTKAGGEELPGLVKRRQIEAALFLTPEQQAAESPQVTPQNQGGIGFTSSKNEKTGEVMTQEQVSELIAQGFKVSGSPSEGGKIFVTDIQSLAPQKGQEIVFNENGTITMRDISVGGKAEKAERAAKFQETRQTNFIIDKANEAEEIIDNSISTYGSGTVIDMAKAKIPGTQEYKLKNQIFPALKDSIALESIRQLKAASPTGSTGLGAVTEKEGKRLENMYGVLEVGGDKVTLKNDLKRLKQTVFDYIHGSKSEREEALAKGSITKEQNDQVEQMYREQILGVTTPAPEGIPRSEELEALRKLYLPPPTQ